MIRSLSFKADPPPPFHTYNYHQKKAIKEGYMNTQSDHDVQSEIIRQIITGLVELFEIPHDYHLVLLSDNKFIHEIFSGKELCKSSMIIQDIDPETGRKYHPDKQKHSLDIIDPLFLHLDISYSSPSDPLDYERFQSFSFKTRYGFGMDQDCVVWIVREDLLDVLKEKYSNAFMEFNHGVTKSKMCLVHDELKVQRIYVFAKIIQDFLSRGLIIIRNEIKYKSIILYNTISDNPNLDPLVKDPLLRSPNILCAHTEIPIQRLIDFMSGNRIEFDVLEGQDAKFTIRISNYPVHSKEQMEFLVDLIEKL
jgi:phosphoserine aminotransferase